MDLQSKLNLIDLNQDKIENLHILKCDKWEDTISNLISTINYEHIDYNCNNESTNNNTSKEEFALNFIKSMKKENIIYIYESPNSDHFSLVAKIPKVESGIIVEKYLIKNLIEIINEYSNEGTWLTVTYIDDNVASWFYVGIGKNLKDALIDNEDIRFEIDILLNAILINIEDHFKKKINK